MKKTYLLTPGPTPIPEAVSQVLGGPIIHHRTAAFEELFQRVRDSLKWLFQTKEEVICLASTGTGAMEAAILNLHSKDETVITINAGKFGERWTKLASAYGLKPFEIKLAAGESLAMAQLEKAFRENPSARSVLFQASETSTGVSLPVKSICEFTRKNGLLSVCDAITACGVFPLPMDEWGIDCLITGSQKALMIPPGLAMIALSARAWEVQSKSNLPKFYFDLAREKKAHLKNQTAWTPAISLIQGVDVALKMMRDEGLDSMFARHALLAKCTREAVKALGLSILAKDEAFSSTSVTAVKVPESLLSVGKKIPKIMREKHGVIITGGQDELEGKIFRLSHFGYVGIFDITTGISCLELVLGELGYEVSFGKGVGAALKCYKEGV